MHKWRPFLWMAIFSLLLLLALDFWHWDDPVSQGLLGFPAWLGYFVLLQLTLTLCIWLFARYGWVDKNNGDGKE